RLGPGAAAVVRAKNAGGTGPRQDDLRGSWHQEDGPDLQPVERRIYAAPVLGPVGAAEQPLFAAEVKCLGIVRVNCQGPDVALDDHAVAGAGEGGTAVGAAEETFADGTDVEAVRCAHVSTPQGTFPLPLPIHLVFSDLPVLEQYDTVPNHLAQERKRCNQSNNS